MAPFQGEWRRCYCQRRRRGPWKPSCARSATRDIIGSRCRFAGTRSCTFAERPDQVGREPHRMLARGADVLCFNEGKRAPLLRHPSFATATVAQVMLHACSLASRVYWNKKNVTEIMYSVTVGVPSGLNGSIQTVCDVVTRVEQLRSKCRRLMSTRLHFRRFH